jgi:hypothetical protein
MKRKSQSEIIKNRNAKSKKLETLCSIPKPFKPKKPVNSKLLFQYANHDSFLEIAASELGLQFIQTEMKKFKQFVRHQQLYHDTSGIINKVLQGQALNSYMENHTAIKSLEENYRLQAMSMVKIYFDYKIPIWDLYITEIMTRKLKCSNGIVYTLCESTTKQQTEYTTFRFYPPRNSPESSFPIHKQAADLALILSLKVPIISIIGQIVGFLY